MAADFGRLQLRTLTHAVGLHHATDQERSADHVVGAERDEPEMAVQIVVRAVVAEAPEFAVNPDVEWRGGGTWGRRPACLAAAVV